MNKQINDKGIINPKIILIGGILILIVIVYLFIFPKGGTYTINQSINVPSYTFASPMNNGEMTIGDTAGDTISGTDIYKGEKPKITYGGNPVVYKIESGDKQKEVRKVYLPTSLTTTINAAIGNGNLTLNAKNLKLESTELAVSNGGLTIALPEKTPLKGKLTLGNGNIVIQVPVNNEVEGFGFHFPLGTPVPEMDLGKSFHKVANGYETNNYKEGGKNTDILITIGNGNIEIRSTE